MWISQQKRKWPKANNYNVLHSYSGSWNPQSTSCWRLGEYSCLGNMVRWAFSLTVNRLSCIYMLSTISYSSCLSESYFHFTHYNVSTIIYFSSFYLRAITMIFMIISSESWDKVFSFYMILRLSLNPVISLWHSRYTSFSLLLYYLLYLLTFDIISFIFKLRY